MDATAGKAAPPAGGITSGNAVRNSCMALEQYFGRTNDSPPSPPPMALFEAIILYVPKAEHTSVSVLPTPVRFAARYKIALPNAACCFNRCTSAANGDLHLDDGANPSCPAPNIDSAILDPAVSNFDREEAPLEMPLILNPSFAETNLSRYPTASRKVCPDAPAVPVRSNLCAAVSRIVNAIYNF